MTGLTVREIRDFRPAAVSEVARALEAQRRIVTQALTVLLAQGDVVGSGRWRSFPTSGTSGSSSGSWGGDAAAAATARASRSADALSGLAASLGASAQAVRELSRRMEQSLSLVRWAEQAAAARGGRVDDSGAAVLPARPPGLEPVLASQLAVLDVAASEAVARATATARRIADDADRDAHRQLWAAARGEASAGRTDLALVAAPPPLAVRGAAFASAAWWRSLTSDERATVINEHPEWVGPRDGLPPSVRHAANLALLARAERSAQAGLRRAESTPAGRGHPMAGRSPLELAREKVAALRAVRAVLGIRDGRPRHLLLVDTTGPVVRTVTSIGDVDRAGHVATWVGGLTTAPERDLERMDRTLSAVRRRAWEQSADIGDPGDVAVVVWMGYAAPQLREALSPLGRSVLSDRVAQEGGPALARFLEGIDAARDTPVHQTLVAHSYGTVVSGHALELQRRVDDVVLYGSPGTPITSLAQAHLKPGSLNVMAAFGDPIAMSGWFVNDPRHVPGAVELVTGLALKPVTNDVMWSSTGHSDYLREGTTSVHNIEAVIAGRPELRLVEKVAP